MLSDKELQARLASDNDETRIVLRRTFQWAEPLIAEPDGSPDDTATPIHITLSFGRLVKPLTPTHRVRRSIRFGAHRHIVDLALCGDGWPLRPGESAVVFTNEWLGLPTDLTGITFSRVSQYNNGIVVAASYIDPRWRGLIKLHVLNSSGRTYRLHLGTPIAKLSLFAVHGEMLAESADSRRGRHYGITWAQILADEVDPFPQRPARPAFREAAIRNTNELLKTYAGYSLLALLGLGVLGGIRLYDQLQQQVDVTSRVDALQEAVDHLEEARVIAGVETVAVVANSASGTSAIGLPEGLTVSADTYVSARPAPLESHATTTAAVRFRSNQPQLEISVELPQPVTQPTDVVVEWFLIP